MGILGQLGQFCFLSLDFFLLPLIFDTDLVEGFLSLAVTGTVDGELGGNPFALALAIYLEVENRIVLLPMASGSVLSSGHSAEWIASGGCAALRFSIR